MAASRAQRMTLVLQLAERERDQLAEQLANLQLRIDAERKQLVELESYLEEYGASVGAMGASMRVDELLRGRDFLHRLDDVKVAQQNKLAAAEAEREPLIDRWKQAHHRCQSIGDIIVRLQREQEQMLDRALQKEIDELINNRR